jgi:hypothetical protein
MPSDLDRDLKDLAPSPRFALNVGEVWRRGEALRRRRALYATAGALVVVVALAGGIALWPNPNGLSGVAPATSPSVSNTDVDRSTVDQRQSLALEIQKEQKRLKQSIREVRDQLEIRRNIRARIKLSLRAQRQAGAMEGQREAEDRLSALDRHMARLQRILGTLRLRLRALQAHVVDSKVVTCKGLNVPADGELNTGLDLERKLLQFDYYDADLRRGRSFTIRYTSRACQQNPETKRLIDHALEAAQ